MELQEKVVNILIGGCPRSGTSWLQFLLASYPGAVSTRETHLYDKYLGPMSEWFSRENVLQGRDGLSDIFSRDEFEREILAPIAGTVWRRIHQRNPEASILVEKTPGNMLHHRLIMKIQPDCKLVYIVRDPRGVVASYKAAGEEEWGSWAKKTISEVCASWNRYSTAYITAHEEWPNDKLYSVRYEDLRTQPTKYLGNIFEWVDLEFSEVLLDDIVSRNDISNLKNADFTDVLRGDGRKSFYRKGECSGWVDDLSADEIIEVEGLCKDFMNYWGYTKWGGR